MRGRGRIWLPVVALVLTGCGGGTQSSSGQLSPLPTAAAAREGLDPERLRAADRRFEETPDLVSVLVMRHGRVVFERYYQEDAQAAERDVFSVTKSVISALVGIALRDGQLDSLDQKLVELFPDELDPDADARVRSVTLRHLLTMTAGYRPTNVGVPEDWVHALMNRSLASDPGRSFAYDDGSAHLLSAVLTRVTGKPAQALAQRELFEPLGIRARRWSSDGQGRSLGSTGLFLRPRDLLTLGQLYLRRGRWQGAQIVPAGWVRESTVQQTAVPGGFAYGYDWWVNTGPHGGFLAQGFAGQMVAVFPRLDLVVVTTGAGEFDRMETLRQLLDAVVR